MTVVCLRYGVAWPSLRTLVNGTLQTIGGDIDDVVTS